MEKTSKSNSQTISLRAEICSVWGYSYKKRSVEEFVNYLKLQGFNVKIIFIPKDGGNGEYDLLQFVNGKSLAIFSNNSDKYPNAVINDDIDPSLFDKIKAKIV